MYATPRSKGLRPHLGKPQPPPKPLSKNYSGVNGALAAATSVAAHIPKHKISTSSLASREDSGRPLLEKQSTGNSVRSTSSVTSPSRTNFSPLGGRLLLPQPEGSRSRSKSPSNIAASLAAARHNQMASKAQDEEDGRDILPAAGTVKARLNAFRGSVQLSNADGSALRQVKTLDPTDMSTDATSIATTNSLVKKFEGSGGIARPPISPRANTAPSVKKQPPPIKGPKPKLPATSGPSSPAVSALKTPPRANVKPKPVERRKPSLAEAVPAGPPLRHLTKARASGPRRTSKRTSQAPKPPQPRRAAQSQRASPAISSTSPISIPTAKEKPILPAPRRGTKPAPTTPSLNSSPKLHIPLSSSPLRASPLSLPAQRLPPPEPQKSPSPAISSAYKRESERRIEKHLTGDSLANAIVSAHLASSRASSPARQQAEPPQLPRRQNHHVPHSLPFHRSRTPSPAKLASSQKPIQLKSTMRSLSSGSEEDERAGRRHFMRKHPNKHREGSRKRWRDRITERERKRYEGVWAANKNVFLPSRVNRSNGLNANSLEDVSALVVRDIWSRSRLPRNILEEVWDLVDSRDVGRLSREEFVVGLWLVDQRLKGRKLPQRVSESVWDSVTGVGVKMRRLK